MGQDNTVPRRINRVEGAAGQLMQSQGPGVLEQWVNPSDIGVDYGLSFIGTVTGVVGAPKFQCSGLIGFGEDFFKGYWAYVVWDADGAGAQPQGQKLECTGYATADADFTVAAFAPNVIAVGDKVLLIHPSLAYMLNLTPTRAGYLDELGPTNIPAFTDPKVMGRLQIATKAWDGRFGDAAGSDPLFTGAGQKIIVEKLIVQMTSVDLTDDPWDGISVEDDYATNPHTFIAAAEGVKANLGINAQLSWTGAVLLDVGQAIQATAIGNVAGEDALIIVYIEFRAVVDGGYVT